MQVAWANPSEDAVLDRKPKTEGAINQARNVVRTYPTADLGVQALPGISSEVKRGDSAWAAAFVLTALAGWAIPILGLVLA